MRHLTSTIERLDLQSQEPPTGDNATSDARAWLLRRIRWELRLAELRRQARTRPHMTTTASTTNQSP